MTTTQRIKQWADEKDDNRLRRRAWLIAVGISPAQAVRTMCECEQAYPNVSREDEEIDW